MSATSAAPRGRALIERQMTSTCTIRARSTGKTTDPNTGVVSDVPGAVHYSGPCRVHPISNRTILAEAGGAKLFEFRYLVSIPFSAVDVVEGDRVMVNTSPDPALIGIDIEVQDVARGDNVTARRLQCRDVT